MDFNSSEYEWADVQVVMGGRSAVGIRGVSYKESQEKEPLHGRGNKPLSIQKGNKTYEAELALLQSEVEAILKKAGKKKGVTDIKPFDVVVSYVPRDSTKIITDIIKMAEFTENEKSLKQGDKFMEITLPIVALDIDFNV
jgi:hypothetical protein